MTRIRFQCFVVVIIGIVLLSTSGVFAANQHSPIKIDKADFTFKSDLNVTDKLEFTYAARNVKVFNPGSTKVSLKVEGFDAADILKVGTTSWKLKNIHFHARGEHELAGNNPAGYKMEMHMVHEEIVGQGQTPRNLAVGRWIEPGGANAELGKLFTAAVMGALTDATPPNPALTLGANNMPDHTVGVTPDKPFGEWDRIDATPAGAPHGVDGFDASTLVPIGADADKRSYRYEGTLTDHGAQGTDVKWIMLHQPIAIANADYTSFVNLLKSFGLTHANGNGMPVIPIANAAAFKASSFTDVPEPSSALLLFAAAGLAGARRAKR